MLLPHVLLQVPEEAEGRPLRTAWALVLQQLPGETPGQPPRPPETQHHQPQGAREPPPPPRPCRYPGSEGQEGGHSDCCIRQRRGLSQTRPRPRGWTPTWKTGATPKTTVPLMAFFLYR